MSDIKIGLEVHVELDTKTKLFCSCKKGEAVCEICLGHPGAKPTLSKQALYHAIKLCRALGCTLSKELIFSRKSYFYPDLPKSFQITQFEQPLGTKGKVKDISLTRIHIEEDPASISYPKTIKDSDYSTIDFSRSGSPLVEIVTDPVITSPKQAREFLIELMSILSYLKIFDPSTILKVDASISIKESDYTRVEIKGITGFKEVEKALRYELARQKSLIRTKQTILRQTRAWAGKTTIPLRQKETEADYGFIIEPDLSIIKIEDQIITQLEKEIPELAYQKSKRYQEQYKLSKTDSEVMVMELELAQLFETIAKEIDPKLAAQWLRRELLRVLHYSKKSIKEITLEKELIELLSLIETKTITHKTAQKIMEMLMEQKFSPKDYIKKQSLTLITDQKQIEEIVRDIISQHPKAVIDFKQGESKAFHYILGQIMKKAKGKTDPKITAEILKKLI